MIDLTGGRPGTYTTSLIYIVSAERVPVELSLITGAYEAQDGDILTGIAESEAHITIAPGAMITLKDATIISITSNNSHKWAGITPLGDVTIIIDGTNTVKGGHKYYPGIFAAEGKTLTISGDGKLTASINNDRYGAGSVKATKGSSTPNSIGAGSNGSCGTVDIASGANVTQN